MFRHEIKVVDATIRDGGLMNEWQFDKALVKDVFDGLAKAGVDYIELGYRADKKQFRSASAMHSIKTMFFARIIAIKEPCCIAA